MIESISLIVAAAGMISGGIFGVTVLTGTEQKKRSGDSINRLFSDGHRAGPILNALLPLIVVGVLISAVSVGILKLGGAYPLSQHDKYVLGFSFLFGAALAKWFRYLYWSRNA